MYREEKKMYLKIVHNVLLTFAATWPNHGASTPEHKSMRTLAALACEEGDIT